MFWKVARDGVDGSSGLFQLKKPECITPFIPKDKIDIIKGYLSEALNP